MSPLLHFHLRPPPAAYRRPQFAVVTASEPSLKLGPAPLFPIPCYFFSGDVHRRWRGPAAAVVCMANPRRVKMVAKQIRREISDMLLTDDVLRFAVLPEAALGADRYLSSLATISDVEISRDLQVVKVYVSVFGDERGKETAIGGLKSKAKYVRSELGKRMKLRLTPEVRFIEDDSIERGSRVIAILDRIKDEKRVAESRNEEEHDWDDDGPDEDIIYVE